MDVFTIQELKTLMAPRGVCTSLYMPTHRYWNDIRQDPITLKNLVRKVEEDLFTTGMRDLEVQKYLAPIRGYIEGDMMFWRHSSDGLAVFMSHDFFRIYRLPLLFESSTVLTDRFQIKPLLPLFTENGIYYILALSQKSVHLYQATRHGMSEIVVAGMPESINDILKYEDTVKTELHHGIRQGPGFNTGFQSYTETLGDDADVLLYSQAVDKGIHPVLRDQNNPLVVAGLEYIQAIYREANTYPHFVPEGVSGNPELTDHRDLHARAWKIVEPIFQERRRKAVERYMNSRGLPVTSRTLEEIVPASAEGRIDTLFVDEAAHVWGTFDSVERTITIHDTEEAGDGDLLDLATVNTLQAGGAAFDLRREDMPEDRPAVAIFRY